MRKLTKEQKRAKKLIQDVVKFLNGPKTRNDSQRDAARDLWSILTALRGPDFKGVYGLKGATTARIRGAINLVPHSGIPADISNDDPAYIPIPESDHFERHHAEAIGALANLDFIKRPVGPK